MRVPSTSKRTIVLAIGRLSRGGYVSPAILRFLSELRERSDGESARNGVVLLCSGRSAPHSSRA